MYELSPRKCHICGGRVEFVSNDVVYGRCFGSGKCYLCTSCGAYVGTHVSTPWRALGTLADGTIRAKRVKCHELFDTLWKGKSNSSFKRDVAYSELARRLGIAEQDCHFGYFDSCTLDKAYVIVEDMIKDTRWRRETKWRSTTKTSPQS